MDDNSNLPDLPPDPPNHLSLYGSPSDLPEYISDNMLNDFVISFDPTMLPNMFFACNDDGPDWVLLFGKKGVHLPSTTSKDSTSKIFLM
eukprot:1312115-Ditylum_brightwellii.AAC.1